MQTERERVEPDRGLREKRLAEKLKRHEIRLLFEIGLRPQYVCNKSKRVCRALFTSKHHRGLHTRPQNCPSADFKEDKRNTPRKTHSGEERMKPGEGQFGEGSPPPETVGDRGGENTDLTQAKHNHITFSRRSYPERLTVSTGKFPPEASRVKCLAQGHNVI